MSHAGISPGNTSFGNLSSVIVQMKEVVAQTSLFQNYFRVAKPWKQPKCLTVWEKIINLQLSY